jgi:hypothetical protein
MNTVTKKKKDEVIVAPETQKAVNNSSVYVGSLKNGVDFQKFLETMTKECRILEKEGKVRYSYLSGTGTAENFTLTCHKTAADVIRSQPEIQYFRCEKY